MNDTGEGLEAEEEVFIPWKGKGVHCVIICVSALVGIPVKVSMVRYLMQNNKGDKRAINSLILLEQIINSLFLPVMLVQVVLVTFPDVKFGTMDFDYFCIFYEWVLFLAMYYRSIGGFGIALYRLFCLRAQTLLRDIIGIPLMTKIIGIGSVSVAVMQATTLQLEAVFVQERYNMYHWNYCVKMARFDHNRLSTSVMVNTSIQILINLCEMGCFILIFYTQSKYNKKTAMTIFKHQPAVMRRREQVNAVSARGHFLTWLTELSIWILVVILNIVISKPNINVVSHFGFLLPSIYFVVFPIVQTLTSHALRRQAAKPLRDFQTESPTTKTACWFIRVPGLTYCPKLPERKQKEQE